MRATTVPPYGRVSPYGRVEDLLLAAAGLCLAVLLVFALATTPVLAAAVLPPTVVLLRRRAQLAHLARAATTDVTTGLLNGYGWRTVAQTIVTRNRPGCGTGILMIDLDHFKAINDRYGHLAGDAVLAAVGGAIARAVRGRDSAGRFGGDEFVVLLSEVTEAELAGVAERIRADIATLHVTIPDQDIPAIADLSVSIGAISRTGGDTSDVRELLHAADNALYAAKRSGRNIICHRPSPDQQ